MHGQVIVLNGVSSSGKTTLAKAIQKYGEDIWLHVAMDNFVAMLPDGREFDRDWFPVTEVQIDGVLHEFSSIPGVREDVTDGLENAPEAFFRMLNGGNFGKTLIRLGPDP